MEQSTTTTIEISQAVQALPGGKGKRMTLKYDRMAMDMSMDMPMGAATDVPALHHAPANGVPSHQEHGICPYGASPTLAALPALSAISQTVPVSATSFISSPQVTYFGLSPRAQSPRGPPLEVGLPLRSLV